MTPAAGSLKTALLALILASPNLAPPPLMAQVIMAQAPGAPGDSAEVTFWNSVKDATSAAEFEAYLEAFPKGIFAPLAKLRIQQLASGRSREPAAAPPPAPNRPPPPPPQQVQPVQPPAPPPQPSNALVDTTNRQLVAEVQNKLFNLNYSVKRTDGVFDTATRDAIRDWQRRIEVDPSGQLTEVLWERLRNSKVPTVWGSVAYTANGGIGRVWNRASRREAEEQAIAECRRRAGRKASCDTLSASDAGCLAVATYKSTVRGTIYYGARVALQPDLARAIANALQQCQDAQRSNNTCVNRLAFCANGSHEK